MSPLVDATEHESDSIQDLCLSDQISYQIFSYQISGWGVSSELFYISQHAALFDLA